MDVTRHASFFNVRSIPWEQRLALAVETMRDLSRQTQPQQLVQTYNARMGKLMAADRYVSLSRRDLEAPRFRVTRTSLWNDSPDPWRQREKLPLLEGGLLAELIYADEPRLIDDLQVDPADPAAPFFKGMRSLLAIPLYDQGTALNMVVLLRAQPAGFERDYLPEHVWMSNLFGRATHNLVLADQLAKATRQIERELSVVADIQRSLLPERLPPVAGLQLAAHYQASRFAGGDYYDVFPLPDGRCGLLIADVAGHGTPAAVIMAVVHSLTHVFAISHGSPAALLARLNEQLAARYTVDTGTFVTAFYGVFDPASHALQYSSAGHCPPRLRRRNGAIESLEDAVALPLGIDSQSQFAEAAVTLHPGDHLVLYTDGVIDHRAASGDWFGLARLDKAVTSAPADAAEMMQAIRESLHRFAHDAVEQDDQTIVVAKVL